MERGSGAQIDGADWAERLRGASIGNAMINELVMDYLVIEGHKEAAAAFAAETGTSAGIDLETVADRMAIRASIESGDIAAAIERTDQLQSSVLADEALRFRLHQQQLIEHIRAGKVEDAIDFAQRELAPAVERTFADDPSILDDLEKTMLLLAYESAHDAPTADLLGDEQRQRTASDLNAAILRAQEQEQAPKLPMMARMLQWAQDELQQKQLVTFPRIDDLVKAAPRSAAEER